MTTSSSQNTYNCLKKGVSPVSNLTSLPNLLTLMRILLIPVFILVFYLPFTWAHGFAAAIFALASFTDWLDGYLARRLKNDVTFRRFS